MAMNKEHGYSNNSIDIWAIRSQAFKMIFIILFVQFNDYMALGRSENY